MKPWEQRLFIWRDKSKWLMNKLKCNIMLKNLCKVIGYIALAEILVFTAGFTAGYLDGVKDRKKES